VSNDSIVKFRPFDNVECCFDIVPVFGNNVTGFGNIVASFGNNVKRNFVLSTKSKQISICFDIVERTKFRSTLLPKPATMSKQHSTLSKESFKLYISVRQCCLDIVAGLSRSVVCVILRFAILTQYRRVTDRHTESQTDRQTHDDG